MALATSTIGLDAVLCAPPLPHWSYGAAGAMTARPGDTAADAGPAPAIATPDTAATAAATAAAGPNFPWSGRRWEDYFAGTIVGGGLLLAVRN